MIRWSEKNDRDILCSTSFDSVWTLVFCIQTDRFVVFSCILFKEVFCLFCSLELPDFTFQGLIYPQGLVPLESGGAC